MPKPDLYLVLAHFISQTLEKWFDVRRYAAEHATPELTTDLAELMFADWQEILAEFLAKNPMGFTAKTITRIEQNSERLLFHLNGHFDFLYAVHGTFLAWNDSRYPALLRHIADPPLGLSLIGTAAHLAHPGIAMVGSRKASGYAMEKAQSLAKELTEAGWLVISGGAYGCDSGAHMGVLAGKRQPCPTIVVFAGGLERLYPRGNRRLFQDIHRSGGLFISERLWNAPYLPRDFPVRNRIISGMAAAVVVIQAAEKSGAMVTANCAIDQGRELLVLSHDDNDVRAAGNRSLLGLGAQAIATSQDIFDALP